MWSELPTPLQLRLVCACSAFFLILGLWTIVKVCTEDIGSDGSGLAPQLISATPWR